MTILNYNKTLHQDNKEKTMTPSVESMKKGTCGCGRSPTGDCIGWHGLTEDEYQKQLAKYLAEQKEH